MTLSSKLPDVGLTIFSVMSQLAAEHRAINLSQGYPDFDVSPALIDRVVYYMRQGCNQYAPMTGVPALREAIAAKVAALYDAVYDPETEVTVTSGATEALYAAITAVVGPGDDVIIVEPAYDAYEPAVRLNGGQAVFVPMTFPGYRMDWERVRQAVSDRTRLLILNSPHNPTGSVLTAEDIAQLKTVVAGSDLLILSDEVYEHIVFDGRRHASMARDPELRRRSFVVSSFGKTYHATGWKIGYCLAPAPLSAELRKVHQYLTFASNTPIQMALADYLDRHTDHLGLSGFYQKKRDFFASLLGPSRFRPLPCEGTYFQMVDYSAISDEPDTAFARRMTIEHGVAAIPPSVFYDQLDYHRVLRFCFAKNEDTLKEAAEKLCRI
ncbi:MAG: pyridoxal phosphate-dependent aminotransferase [Deltaproteobacteria bacterium]|nr:pyridoxal phosphate-dependent aminotransferase [Deltaproteobacteria bacterium]